ncbi:MAG: hypothetical protein Fur007_08390 [Rhodoferax sp.]
MPRAPSHIAVIGAGMAGVACARSLVQAGLQVTLFDKSRGLGGRMATRHSDFGDFDHGAQYFTARDPRFVAALAASPDTLKRWSANAVQVLDAAGQVSSPAQPRSESHWVGSPGMKSLVDGWARALAPACTVHTQSRVEAIEPDALHPQRWQLRVGAPDEAHRVFAGFDGVLLAMPHAQAQALLREVPAAAEWVAALVGVTVAPCWTLMLAFPLAMQPGLQSLGPQWNAARSTHHRIAWLARESSKPGRSPIERWTVQASAQWSQEHLHDDVERVRAKLIKAFAEVTGIRAEPGYVDSQRWLYAKTQQPLGRSHLWNAAAGLGVCGDWCIGHRVEDAFVSGTELGQSVVLAAQAGALLRN